MPTPEANHRQKGITKNRERERERERESYKSKHENRGSFRKEKKMERENQSGKKSNDIDNINITSKKGFVIFFRLICEGILFYFFLKRKSIPEGSFIVVRHRNKQTRRG